MAADPRARVFVLFLDTYHVHQASAANVRRPLVNMLNRVVGPDDLLAVMTPDMAASDITFTRRTDKVADMLYSAGMWGQRDALVKRDPVDSMYEQCYPPPAGSGRTTSEVAEAMIQRRREKMTLDAIEELVRHLGGIREERKAILLVSEGWLLFRPTRALAESSTPQHPGIFVGPDGKLTNTNARDVSAAARRSATRTGSRSRRSTTRGATWTSSTRRTARTRASTRSNRGASRSSTPTSGRTRRRPSTWTRRCCSTRHEALRTAALNTDGIAVMDSNDIDKGLQARRRRPVLVLPPRVHVDELRSSTGGSARSRCASSGPASRCARAGGTRRRPRRRWRRGRGPRRRRR